MEIKKELERGEINNDHITNAAATSTTTGQKNAFSSIFQKTAYAIEKTQTAHTAAQEAQIKELHRENIRRFRGHPPGEGGTAKAKDNGVDNNENNNIKGNNQPQFTSKTSLRPEPCTGGKFLVTKLRNWRTGYERILSLHDTYFTTLEPETNEITNLWHYSQVKQYSSLVKEEDCGIFRMLQGRIFGFWWENYKI